MARSARNMEKTLGLMSPESILVRGDDIVE
jgi:hypothetical protein